MAAEGAAAAGGVRAGTPEREPVESLRARQQIRSGHPFLGARIYYCPYRNPIVCMQTPIFKWVFVSQGYPET